MNEILEFSCEKFDAVTFASRKISFMNEILGFLYEKFGADTFAMLRKSTVKVLAGKVRRVALSIFQGKLNQL